MKPDQKFIYCLLILLLIVTTRVDALEFGYGQLQGNFDTTFSYGASWRVQDRDSGLIGRANGGDRYSVNGDDGNLNYDKGLVSNVLKGTHDLDLNYGRFAAFVRASYFQDFENDGNEDLVPEAERVIDQDFEFLDAYVHGSFDMASRPLDVRIGNQVVSWGESTFIQNSINVLNPIDVSKFRIPGAELREALVPVPMLWVSHELTDVLSVEAVALTRFDHVEIDPRGSYFSSNDFASVGGEYVVVGFGAVDDDTCPGTFCIPRNPDRDADDSGQFGIAAHYLAPGLNDTEFGFFYINYHSRLPIISANAVTTILPGPPATPIPSSAQYFIEYPEDIKLFGVSFNTVLGNGTALQGEISHRQDVPLQVDDVELVLSALCSPASQLGACLSGLGNEISGYIRRDVTQLQFTATKSIGASNAFNANQWIMLGEFGLNYVDDMPDESILRLNGPGTSLPGSAAVAAGSSPPVPQQTDGFADDTSWGYRLLTRLTYNNAFAAVNLSPGIAFSHDVKGTSPGPGGNFIEDRKALSIKLGASYLNQWTGGLSYTRFYGAGNANSLHDRDFASMNIKYSF